MQSEVPHRGYAPPNDGMSAARVVFPREQEDFENDPRVSYSKLEKKYILEDDDGSEWEFDDVAKRWIPSVDEALLEQQRQAYIVEGVEDTAETAQQRKKRKLGEDDPIDDTGIVVGKPKKAKPQKPAQERKNTAVYVTSLPLDVTATEVHDVFSKYGVIAEEIDTSKPRIKLYTDDSGTFKGDALVVYFRPESVGLAVQMLDDTDFRLGQEGSIGRMTVKAADMSYKKVQDRPTDQKGPTRDKKKIIKKTQKLNNQSKLADWDDDDPSAITDTSSRWDKVVILKHMFTMQELEEDPAAILDIKEDIRDECSKLGEITNVQLFDKERDGVASVRYGNAVAAKACIRLMDGRMFAGQKVEAYLADGSERFKKTSEKKGIAADGDESGDEEGKRLDLFGTWLEKDAEEA